MKCKGRFVKIVMVLMFGFFAINLSWEGNNVALTREQQRNSQLVGLVPDNQLLSDLTISNLNRPAEPLDRVFQLIFILFFISPPLIVVMLFLIWRELKAKNRMK